MLDFKFPSLFFLNKKSNIFIVKFGNIAYGGLQAITEKVNILQETEI